jgi:hypothetical protein
VGIIEASKNKPYKIITWVLLALGGMFLVFGGLLLATSMSGSSTPPTSIHFTGSGMSFVNEGAGRYEFDIFEPETSVMVNTLPWGSGSRVTFDVLTNSTALRITDRSLSDCTVRDCDHTGPRCHARDLTTKNRNGRHHNAVWPGDSFYLTLVGTPTSPFQFGRTVEIQIFSGARTTFLNVNIVLPPDQARIVSSLSQPAFGLQLTQISARDYYDEIYHLFVTGNAQTPRNESSFKFSSRLEIWNVEVRSGIRIAQPVSVGYVNTDGRHIPLDSEIRLTDIPMGTIGFENGFFGIYIPLNHLVEVINRGRPMDFMFMVTAEHTGDHTQHFGKHIDFFTLRIVP